MILPIEFEGHCGTMNTATKKAIFYGIEFENILWAAKILRHLVAERDYRGGTSKEGEIYIHCLNDDTCFMFEDMLWIPKMLVP